MCGKVSHWATRRPYIGKRVGPQCGLILCMTFLVRSKQVCFNFARFKYTIA